MPGALKNSGCSEKIRRPDEESGIVHRASTDVRVVKQREGETVQHDRGNVSLLKRPEYVGCGARCQLVLRPEVFVQPLKGAQSRLEYLQLPEVQIQLGKNVEGSGINRPDVMAGLPPLPSTDGRLALEHRSAQEKPLRSRRPAFRTQGLDGDHGQLDGGQLTRIQHVYSLRVLDDTSVGQQGVTHGRQNADQYQAPRVFEEPRVTFPVGYAHGPAAVGVNSN